LGTKNNESLKNQSHAEFQQHHPALKRLNSNTTSDNSRSKNLLEIYAYKQKVLSREQNSSIVFVSSVAHIRQIKDFSQLSKSAYNLTINRTVEIIDKRFSFSSADHSLSSICVGGERMILMGEEDVSEEKTGRKVDKAEQQKPRRQSNQYNAHRTKTLYAAARLEKSHIHTEGA
jgi:hypothetical protein